MSVPRPKGEGDALHLSGVVSSGGLDGGLIDPEELRGICAPLAGFDIGHLETHGPLGGL